MSKGSRRQKKSILSRQGIAELTVSLLRERRGGGVSDVFFSNGKWSSKTQKYILEANGEKDTWCEWLNAKGGIATKCPFCGTGYGKEGQRRETVACDSLICGVCQKHYCFFCSEKLSVLARNQPKHNHPAADAHPHFKQWVRIFALTTLH